MQFNGGTKAPLKPPIWLFKEVINRKTSKNNFIPLFIHKTTKKYGCNSYTSVENDIKFMTVRVCARTRKAHTLTATCYMHADPS